MSAPATQARPVTTRDSVGRSSWQTAPWPMTRPSPTPPSSQRASRHFLPLAWAWSNSWKRPHNTPSRSISLVGFLLSGQGFSERASFFIGFSDFSVFVLGYHSYHRELGYRLFLFLFSNLIMAGSWGGYLIAFTARRQAALVFWYKKRRSNATSPPLGTRRGQHNTPFFVFLIPLVGSLGETRLGRLVIMIPPLPCVLASGHMAPTPSVFFSLQPCLSFLSYG